MLDGGERGKAAALSAGNLFIPGEKDCRRPYKSSANKGKISVVRLIECSTCMHLRFQIFSIPREHLTAAGQKRKELLYSRYNARKTTVEISRPPKSGYRRNATNPDDDCKYNVLFHSRILRSGIFGAEKVSRQVCAWRAWLTLTTETHASVLLAPDYSTIVPLHTLYRILAFERPVETIRM